MYSPVLFAIVFGNVYGISARALYPIFLGQKVLYDSGPG
jgi:hypothetical protein